MARILVSVLPASGHINPILAIAQALTANGHNVSFTTDQSYSAQLERAGYLLYPMAYPEGAVQGAQDAFRQPARWISQFSLHPPQSFFFRHLDALTDSIIMAIDTFQPDILLTDLNQYAGPIAADARQLPYASYCAIVNPILSRDIPPFGMGLDWAPKWHWKRLTWPVLGLVLHPILWRYDRIVNRVRRRHNLPPVRGALLAHSPYLTLVPVTDAYEYPRSDLPREVMYVGPVTTPHRGEVHDDFPLEFFDDERPVIYVSMGTIVRGDRVFRHVIELARNANWKAVVAIGRNSNPLDYHHLPDNVIVRQFVPQLEILPRVDAVISHGGNNTVTETLMHGLPLVVIPISADQPDSAAHVAAIGAGIRLSPWRLTRGKLEQAIEAVLVDSRFREAAQRIQASYALTDGPQTSARLIELLAATGQPIRRSVQMSPTILPHDVEKMVAVMVEEANQRHHLD